MRPHFSAYNAFTPDSPVRTRITSSMVETKIFPLLAEPDLTILQIKSHYFIPSKSGIKLIKYRFCGILLVGAL